MSVLNRDRSVRPVCTCGTPMRLVVNRRTGRRSPGVYGCPHCDAVCRVGRGVCPECNDLHHPASEPQS